MSNNATNHQATLSRKQGLFMVFCMLMTLLVGFLVGGLVGIYSENLGIIVFFVFAFVSTILPGFFYTREQDKVDNAHDWQI